MLCGSKRDPLTATATEVEANMAQSPLQPQLVMRRAHLRDLPPIELPPGYGLRHYRPGDEPAWERIIEATFEARHSFDDHMRADPAFLAERIWFVTHGAVPVATASAWVTPRFGPSIGCLHMVATLPAHQGRQLGFRVSVAALYRFVEEGRREAVLQTDDFRVAALKTYLRMGFEPLLVHDNQRERWLNIFRALSRPDLEERLASIFQGSLTRRA
jgi:mycothiol synthase